MVQSSTESVFVAKLDSELTMGLERTSGPPGDVDVIGALYKAGTIVVIPNAEVEVYVNGVLQVSVVTNSSGRYSITIDFPEGSFTVYTSWMGNETYNQDASPPVNAVYGKIQAAISINLSPSSGAPPLTTRTTGLLTTVAGAPLGGKTVHQYRDGVLINSMVTKTTSPGQGAYDFSDVIDADTDYYVIFLGDDEYAGCEAGQSIGLPCTVCGNSIPTTSLGSEVECEVCHSVFETVIV